MPRSYPRIGIMQGRLSPRPADRLQAFPHHTWRDEFTRAKALGFDAIEWIFEADRHQENPISTAVGRARIRAVVGESGLPVGSVCADYFMVRRLAGESESTRRENTDVLRELIAWTRELGASRILLPLLETSAVETEELKAQAVASLRDVAKAAAHHGVVLGLETELPGDEYRELVTRVGHPNVRAYYDVGNSTAQGRDVAIDVMPLLGELYAVHLKDRKRLGGSVFIGTGDTNFLGFFGLLKQCGFAGDMVLQHFFETEPEATAARALSTIRNIWQAARTPLPEVTSALDQSVLEQR
ncbi:MAG TPA: sugar phosphate isomerase/epimerase family protein [Polyangiaceae bacterium]|nr:sugar phosphate isomerase/epimerase family protein [Polyangiaceae bacterium]